MSSAIAIEPNSLDVPTAVEPAATPKPRLWTPFATWIASAIAGQVAVIAGFAAIAFVIAFQTGGDQNAFQEQYNTILSSPLPMLLVTLLPFQAGMLFVVLAAGKLSKEPTKERLGLLPQNGRTFGKNKLITMAAFTMAGAFSLNIVSGLLIGPPPADDALAAALIDASFWTVTLLTVLLSVIPATVEEMLFRGYMQRRFLKRWSPKVAITVSSLLFAVMHLDSVQHIIAVIPLGVVTGLLAYKTNSVKPGMIVHGVHNVAAVLIGAGMTAASQYYSDEVLGLIFLGSIPVLGAIGLPAIISLLRNPKQPQVETYSVPEEPVESLSVLKRELALPEYATESRNTTQAV